MQVIQMICNKVVVMENGKVVEQGGVMEVQASVTQEFVRTVIKDQISNSIVELLHREK